MQTIHYKNSIVKGTLQVPGDKSISHRAIMLSSIAEGKSTITGFLNGEDCLRTIAIFEQLGVSISIDGTDVVVESPGISNWQTPSSPLYAGNSGTTARLMLGILAGSPIEATISGDASLSSRPMDRVTIPLRQMGALIEGETKADLLPLTVKGTTVNGIHYKSPVASAQVKSAILFAGLHAEGETSVEEETVSRDHTEQMMRYFNVPVTSKGTIATIRQGESLTGKTVHVPGDISSAAFFIVAAGLVPGSSLTLTNVGLNETRTGILDVVKEMGIGIELENVSTENGEAVGTIHVSHRELKGIEIGGDLIPRLIDELPIIALLATQATGTTIIKDAAELRVKETDRILAVTNELTKIGANIEATPDGMVIHGPTPLKGGIMDSYGDHRLGMMAGIASLISSEPISIEDVACIDISYPTFFQDLNSVTQD